jgi:4-hydroxy-4-methyl-2-oxoglutarate aldolase
MTDSAELLRRCLALDTCAVSDALDARGGGGGVAAGLHPLWEGARMAGRAVTMLLRPGPASAPGPHLGARAIEAGGPDDVIVVANAGRTEMGSWGGLLSLAAAQRQIRGVVADGAIRDVDEAREAAFPAFARAGVPRTARGRIHEAAVNVPVELAGVLTEPGDLIMADGSGVVIVPWGQAAEVVAAAEDIQRAEQEMAAHLRAGAPATQVLGRKYESMLTGPPGPGNGGGAAGQPS